MGLCDLRSKMEPESDSRIFTLNHSQGEIALHKLKKTRELKDTDLQDKECCLEESIQDQRTRGERLNSTLKQRWESFSALGVS